MQSNIKPITRQQFSLFRAADVLQTIYADKKWGKQQIFHVYLNLSLKLNGYNGFRSTVPHFAHSTIQWSDPSEPNNPSPSVPLWKTFPLPLANEKPVFITSAEIEGLIFALVWNKRLPRVIWHNSQSEFVGFCVLYNNSEGFCWQIRK